MSFRGRIIGLICFLSSTAGWSFDSISQGSVATLHVLLAIAYGGVGWLLGKKYDHAKYLAEKDVLTEAYNRRFAFRVFPKLLAKVNKEKKTLSVLIVDADNLKTLNDIYGHQVGDLAIQYISKVLLNHTTKSDIVARIGGDEFLIIAPYTDKESSFSIIDRIEKDLTRISAKLQISISASIGVASLSEAQTLEGLIRVADANMYEKKFDKPKVYVKSR